ncbi:hypothetical protein C0J52_28076 [Blattella germanica]|nr:hypothetical protein C0J52_28076 [Blattella germanica]
MTDSSYYKLCEIDILFNSSAVEKSPPTSTRSECKYQVCSVITYSVVNDVLPTTTLEFHGLWESYQGLVKSTLSLRGNLLIY